MFSAAWFIFRLPLRQISVAHTASAALHPLRRRASRSNRNASARTYTITRIFIAQRCINAAARSAATSLQRHIETAQPAQEIGALVRHRGVGIFQPKIRESLERS